MLPKLCADLPVHRLRRRLLQQLWMWQLLRAIVWLRLRKQLRAKLRLWIGL
jgi:hypothetical protein